MPLPDDLKKVTDCKVLDDPETLAKYSKDASIFQITPKAVVFPRNSDDVKKLVSFVNTSNNLSLTVRSAGTDMSGGAINDSIILDITSLNKLIEIGENEATTQPGLFYRDFEAETLKHSLILPCYPASREICTVGGMVSTDAAGEMTLSYGKIDQYVKSLSVILADGNEYAFKPLSQAELNTKLAQKDFEGKIYSSINTLIENNRELIAKSKPDVSKNSTGYNIWNVWNNDNFDLTNLFVGSQGTLGIITEIKFKLVKPKKHAVLLVIEMPTFDNLDKIINEILKFDPESFECFDDETYKLATAHAWDLAKSFKENNLISAYFSFIKDIMRSSQGKLPKLVLMANFTADSKEAALEKAKNAQSQLKNIIASEVNDSASSAEKYWIIRHKSFGLLRKYAENGTASSFIDDIIIKPEYLPEFLPKFNAIIEPFKDKMIYTFAGHIGDGNFHIIPLMDLSREDVRKIIPEIMEKVFDLVFQYKGSMSAEHNDGLIRGPYLPRMFDNNIYEIFKQIKSIFDPKNIFNPHKKTDATFKYSMGHMIKT